MHVSDGVLTLPVALSASVGAVGLLAWSLKGIKEKEIPKISILASAFFVCSLIALPVGPTSVHPLLGGLIGLLLGRRAPIAIFIGLLFQVLLFQHGGITTLGANTLMMAIPAVFVAWLLHMSSFISVFWKGILAGSGAIMGGLVLLIGFLMLSSPLYSEGIFSVVHILLLSYAPLILLEGLFTGMIIRFLSSARPELLRSP